MFAIVLAVALSGQSPAAEAGGGGIASERDAESKGRRRAVQAGEFFVYSEVMPAVPGDPRKRPSTRSSSDWGRTIWRERSTCRRRARATCSALRCW